MSLIMLFNKPFGVLSQFTGTESQQTLADFIEQKNLYAAGRLDKDSEGLLLLTDDGKLQHKISDPRHKTAKTYLVQVEGCIDKQALAKLSAGVRLKDGMTRPAQVKVIEQPELWPRDPPIRVRQQIPTSWIEVTITEGRNRQVRRMTAAVGFPTLRLIRWQIGDWKLGQLQPGQWQVLEVD